MNKPNIKKMIGNPFHVPRGLRDSDGDGVKDMLDCKPHDKTKQGFIHRVARQAAKAIPGKKLRVEAQAAITSREEISEARKKAARAERKIQEVKIAEARERFRAERKIKFIRSGGVAGSIGRGIRETGRGIGMIARAAPRTQVATRTRRKGQKGRRKVTTRAASVAQTQPRQLPNIADFKIFP